MLTCILLHDTFMPWTVQEEVMWYTCSFMFLIEQNMNTTELKKKKKEITDMAMLPSLIVGSECWYSNHSFVIVYYFFPMSIKGVNGNLIYEWGWGSLFWISIHAHTKPNSHILYWKSHMHISEILHVYYWKFSHASYWKSFHASSWKFSWFLMGCMRGIFSAVCMSRFHECVRAFQ